MLATRASGRSSGRRIWTTTSRGRLARVHRQTVDHPVADRQNRFSAFAGRVVAGYFVEEQMFNAVGGEIEEDCCTAGNQADQDTQDDRARQDAPVRFFQVVDEVIEIGHG